MEVRWAGQGVEEKGYWNIPEGDRLIVAVNSRYFRLPEVETLLGDSSKAKAELG